MCNDYFVAKFESRLDSQCRIDGAKIESQMPEHTVTISVNAAEDMSPATFGLPGIQYLWSPADIQHSEQKMNVSEGVPLT